MQGKNDGIRSEILEGVSSPNPDMFRSVRVHLERKKLKGTREGRGEAGASGANQPDKGGNTE